MGKLLVLSRQVIFGRRDALFLFPGCPHRRDVVRQEQLGRILHFEYLLAHREAAAGVDLRVKLIAVVPVLAQVAVNVRIVIQRMGPLELDLHHGIFHISRHFLELSDVLLEVDSRRLDRHLGVRLLILERLVEPDEVRIDLDLTDTVLLRFGPPFVQVLQRPLLVPIPGAIIAVSLLGGVDMLVVVCVYFVALVLLVSSRDVIEGHVLTLWRHLRLVMLVLYIK